MLLDKEKMKHREEKRTRKRNQDRAILYDLAKVQTKKETTLNYQLGQNRAATNDDN